MVIIRGTRSLTRPSPSPILPVDCPFDTSKDLYIVIQEDNRRMRHRACERHRIAVEVTF